jgi:hypothetical protein
VAPSRSPCSVPVWEGERQGKGGKAGVIYRDTNTVFQIICHEALRVEPNQLLSSYGGASQRTLLPLSISLHDVFGRGYPRCESAWEEAPPPFGFSIVSG